MAAEEGGQLLATATDECSAGYDPTEQPAVLAVVTLAVLIFKSRTMDHRHDLRPCDDPPHVRCSLSAAPCGGGAAAPRAAPIREDIEYGGVRIRTQATIGARIPIQVDVGFGDAITLGPIEIDYLGLLDAPPERVRSYPIETVIAGEVHALATHGPSTWRRWSSTWSDFCCR